MANYFRLDLAGDLAGTMPVASVVKLRGTPVSSTTPPANGVLSSNGSTWNPSNTPIITNVIDGFTTTVSSTTPIVLTAASTQQQYITGTAAQTVRLPQTSTLTLGQKYKIVNRSTVATSVQTFVSISVVSIPANTMYEFTVVSIITDVAAGWAFVLSPATSATSVIGLTASRMVYSSAAGVLTVAGAATNGQLLIGSTGAIPVVASLTAGTGMSITNGAGSITLVNNGVTGISAGANITISGSTGVVTINATLSGAVTSITGTANQINVSASTGAVTVSLPSAVTTGSLTLSGLTANSFLYSGTAGLLTTTAAPTNGQVLIGVTGSAPVSVSLGGDVLMANSTGSVTVRSVSLLPINATTGANSSIYFGYSSTLPTGTQSVGVGYQALNVSTGTRNTALGVTTGTSVSSGTNNTLIGYNAGSSVSTLSNNVVIGSTANSTVAGAVAIGFGVTANQTGGFFVAHRGPLSTTTNVAGFIAGTNELVELSSSRRYKTNIRDLESDVGDKIDLIRPVRYNPMEGHGEPESEHIGMIAEELEELWPEFISKDVNGIVSGITYDRIVAVLIKEIQSLRRRVSTLEKV